MPGTWRSKVGGWGLALVTAVVLSAGVAMAAGAGSGSPSHLRASAGQPARCSRKEPRIPAQGWPAAEHNLAPTGASAIRLCRYSGLNDHPPLILVRARLLNRPRLVAQLVKRFDGLPSGPQGAVSCPADDGSEIVALVSYPGGHRVRISVGLTGCLGVSNGSVNRTASGYGPHPARGPRLLAELKRLVGGGRSAAAKPRRRG